MSNIRLRQKGETVMMTIDYVCPRCGHAWQEEYECACDSECPECGCSNIQATSFTELNHEET